MAYKKPNLYSINGQEMINNIAMSNNSGGCGGTWNYGCTWTGTVPPGCGFGPNSVGNPTQPSACIQRPSWQSAAPLMGVQANERDVCIPTTIGTCGSITYNPTICHINQKQGNSAPIDFESDDFISIDLDPHTNEIKITAGSAYPIEQLAELCRELYT